MIARRFRRSLGVLLVLFGFGLIFWLTSVAMSSLPDRLVVAVNVHGLSVPGSDGSNLRPAPLSLSLLDDAQRDSQGTDAATPSLTPLPQPSRGPVTTPAARPTPTPTPTPSPTASGSPLPTPPITPTASVAPATITGQVIDSQTRLAIIGATVTASPGGATATTDVNGNYMLGVAAGAYTVTASNPTYNSASQSGTAKAGQSLIVNFKLVSITAYGSLSGTVTDATTRAPIVGATVMLSNGMIRTTDLNGNFSYSIVLNGSYTLTVSALRYVSQNLSVTIKPGHTTTVQVALSA